MKITLTKAAELLRDNDNILILTHEYPDGDTIGSGYALCYALRETGKNADVVNFHEIPAKYRYITDGYENKCTRYEYIVSADVADKKLLGGELCGKYGDAIDLCIDHHATNTGFAKYSYVDSKAAATCEIALDLISGIGCEITQRIADCLFTGLSTDTGCFKYSNVTSYTHMCAAKLISCGARAGMINRVMFDVKSRNRIALENKVMNGIKFFSGGRIALVVLTLDMLKNTDEGDIDGISSIPRMIEGVETGITVREKAENAYKISVRCTGCVSAAAVCRKFGGGGHEKAAGCVIEGDIDDVTERIVKAAAEELK